MFEDLWPAGLAGLCAAILMPFAIRSRRVGHDNDFNGVQKVHDVSTSRLGGFNVFVAYLAVLAIAVCVKDAEPTPALPLMLCSLPVVLVGIWEDLTHRVHPWHRLAGAVASAALASWFATGIIARLDVPFLDDGLKYLLFVLPLTWFMVAGACNAINLIDGAHGLAGGTTLMMFGGLAAAAAIVGDALVRDQALAMMGAIIGFLVWNYPRGKVFLGDAGAYFLGFMYAELSIQIVARNPAISAWFVIALGAYPIVETLYSMYRRRFLLRTASMRPDAGHLHSLIYRRLVRSAHSAHAREAVRRANAHVAPRLWLHGAICLVAALLLHNHTPALIGFTLLYAVGYVVIYRSIARTRNDDSPPHAEPDARSEPRPVARR